MKRAALLFSLIVFSNVGVLSAQTSGYTLVKTDRSFLNPSKSSLSFFWVATNRTKNNGNFFIYDRLPAGYQIQSVRQLGSSSLNMNAALPVAGPATFLLGPFTLAAGESCTFYAGETLPENLGSSKPKAPRGETFAILSQAQLSGMNGQVAADAEALLEKAGTPATGESQDRELVQSAAVVPNISRNGQPVDFLVDLNGQASIQLQVLSISGEKIFGVQTQGADGNNQLTWKLQNNNGQPVASGLYLYCLVINGGGAEQIRTGKVVIFR